MVAAQAYNIKIKLSQPPSISFQATAGPNPGAGIRHAKSHSSPFLLLQHLDPLTHGRPAIMLMIPPTPLLAIPPRRCLLSLPLQPPNQFSQEAFVPAILRTIPASALFPSTKPPDTRPLLESKADSAPKPRPTTQLLVQKCKEWPRRM